MYEFQLQEWYCSRIFGKGGKQNKARDDIRGDLQIPPQNSIHKTIVETIGQ